MYRCGEISAKRLEGKRTDPITLQLQQTCRTPGKPGICAARLHLSGGAAMPAELLSYAFQIEKGAGMRRLDLWPVATAKATDFKFASC
jgi:hypothetical protein